MIIGIIGGVGSGKSAVMDHLRSRNYICLSADNIAKKLEEPGQSIYLKLVECFGEQILASCEECQDPSKTCGAYKEGGLRPISKARFAGLIFSDSVELEKANSIIHPAVWQYIKAAVESERQAAKAEGREPRAAAETALPRNAFPSLCDEVWFIYADRETRIKRLMTSRGYTLEKCLSIMDDQLSDEEFIALSDYVIDNSGSPEETLKRVEELLNGEQPDGEHRNCEHRNCEYQDGEHRNCEHRNCEHRNCEYQDGELSGKTAVQPEGIKPADEKLADTMEATVKPADEKRAAIRAAAEKPADISGAAIKPADEKPASARAAAEKPADISGAAVKPADEKPASVRAAAVKPDDISGAAVKPAAEEGGSL